MSLYKTIAKSKTPGAKRNPHLGPGDYLLYIKTLKEDTTQKIPGKQKGGDDYIAVDVAVLESEDAPTHEQLQKENAIKEAIEAGNVASMWFGVDQFESHVEEVKEFLQCASMDDEALDEDAIKGLLEGDDAVGVLIRCKAFNSPSKKTGNDWTRRRFFAVPTAMQKKADELYEAAGFGS